jgi:DNA-binding transcriptional regulator GbsR (MarR family)
MRPNLQSTQNRPLDIFIEGWGRMAGAWGISKVMAEIYALLYLSNRPLCLEEMSEKLKTSRSNISVNVRSLQDLGVARKVLIPGERKDYYIAEEDIVKVAKRLASEKKKKELDPALEIMEKALTAAAEEDQSDRTGDESTIFYAERLKALQSLIFIVEGVFNTFIDGASKDTIPFGKSTKNNP